MGAQILAGSADMCAMTGLIALGLLAALQDVEFQQHGLIARLEALYVV